MDWSYEFLASVYPEPGDIVKVEFSPFLTAGKIAFVVPASLVDEVIPFVISCSDAGSKFFAAKVVDIWSYISDLKAPHFSTMKQYGKYELAQDASEIFFSDFHLISSSTDDLILLNYFDDEVFLFMGSELASRLNFKRKWFEQNAYMESLCLAECNLLKKRWAKLAT
jgi:hypothetical protein